MTPGDRIVENARAMLGAPFRLHGRDARSGLDCVGLAAMAIRAGGVRVDAPSGYGFASGNPDTIAAILRNSDMVEVADDKPGDLILFRAGHRRMHLAIATDDGFVHADAGLGRVVERPHPHPWPVLARWRIDTHRNCREE